MNTKYYFWVCFSYFNWSLTKGSGSTGKTSFFNQIKFHLRQSSKLSTTSKQINREREDLRKILLGNVLHFITLLITLMTRKQFSYRNKENKAIEKMFLDMVCDEDFVNNPAPIPPQLTIEDMEDIEDIFQSHPEIGTKIERILFNFKKSIILKLCGKTKLFNKFIGIATILQYFNFIAMITSLSNVSFSLFSHF